jgi:hypothetical protein
VVDETRAVIRPLQITGLDEVPALYYSIRLRRRCLSEQPSAGPSIFGRLCRPIISGARRMIVIRSSRKHHRQPSDALTIRNHGRRRPVPERSENQRRMPLMKAAVAELMLAGCVRTRSRSVGGHGLTAVLPSSTSYSRLNTRLRHRHQGGGRAGL